MREILSAIETALPMQTPAQTGHGQIWGWSNVPAGSHVQGRHDISPSKVSSPSGVQFLRSRSSLRMARTMDDAGWMESSSGSRSTMCKSRKLQLLTLIVRSQKGLALKMRRPLRIATAPEA